MTSQTILFIILIIFIFLLSNYIAFIYGLRIGKAMQKDIPPVPVEPITKAVKKAYTLIKSKVHKSYIQKKADKQEDNFWD